MKSGAGICECVVLSTSVERIDRRQLNQATEIEPNWIRDIRCDLCCIFVLLIVMLERQ